jgi:hypothetical protein
MVAASRASGASAGSTSAAAACSQSGARPRRQRQQRVELEVGRARRTARREQARRDPGEVGGDARVARGEPSRHAVAVGEQHQLLQRRRLALRPQQGREVAALVRAELAPAGRERGQEPEQTQVLLVRREHVHHGRQRDAVRGGLVLEGQAQPHRVDRVRYRRLGRQHVHETPQLALQLVEHGGDRRIAEHPLARARGEREVGAGRFGVVGREREATRSPGREPLGRGHLAEARQHAEQARQRPRAVQRDVAREGADRSLQRARHGGGERAQYRDHARQLARVERR